MAETLFNKIKNAGKVTTDATAEPAAAPLTDLSAAMGQNVPTDQMSASLLGANPDQVKMVGGAPQMRNAIQKNAQGAPADLGTQQRTAQTRKTPNADEKTAIEQQQRLANVGSLDNRVQTLVQQKMDIHDKTLQLEVDDSKLAATLNDTQKARVKELAMKITSGSATPQETAELNQLVGRNIDTVLSKEEIGKFLKTPEQLAEEQAAKAIQNKVTLSDLTPTELGYNSYDELAADLNLDPAKMADMNVTDLIAAVQSKQRIDYSSADRWRQVLADPTSSTNDKAEAQNMLQEMGATGIREVSDDMKKLSADVAASNTIDFGGETYTVDELLKDETVAGIAKQYFNDPAAAARIKASSPGLASFFDQHNKLFSDATQHIGEEVTKLNTALSGRKAQIDKIKTYFGADTTALIPDLGKVTTEDLKMPAFTTDTKIGEADKVGIGSVVGSLNKMSPDMAKRVMNLNYDDMKSLGLTSETGRQDFMTFATVQNTLNKPADQVDPANLIASIYGSPGDISKKLYGIKAAGGQIPSILDENQDGIMDDYATVAQRLRRQYAGQDLVGGYRSNNPMGQSTSLQNIVSQFSDPNTVKGSLYKYGQDGSISNEDVGAISELFTEKTTKNQADGMSGFAELAARDQRFIEPWNHASYLSVDGGFKAQGIPYSMSDLATQSKGQAILGLNAGDLQQRINVLNNAATSSGFRNLSQTVQRQITSYLSIFTSRKASVDTKAAADKKATEDTLAKKLMRYEG